MTCECECGAHWPLFRSKQLEALMAELKADATAATRAMLLRKATVVTGYKLPRERRPACASMCASHTQ